MDRKSLLFPILLSLWGCGKPMDEACTGVTDTDTDTDCPDNVVAIVSSDTELDAALEVLLGLLLRGGRREGRDDRCGDDYAAAGDSHGCRRATMPRSSSMTSHPAATFCRRVTSPPGQSIRTVSAVPPGR